MARGHLNPGQGQVVTRLLTSAKEEEGDRVRDQLMLDEIKERARLMWIQPGGVNGCLPTTYQSHFQGIQVNGQDRTAPRPASRTRKHKPQSNKWFYTTTFNSLPGKLSEDSTVQTKDNKQPNAEPKESKANRNGSTSYEIDSRAVVEVLQDLEQASRPRTDGSTWRGEFSMRPEWRPTIRHHRLRPLSPPLPIQSQY